MLPLDLNTFLFGNGVRQYLRKWYSLGGKFQISTSRGDPDFRCTFGEPFNFSIHFMVYYGITSTVSMHLMVLLGNHSIFRCTLRNFWDNRYSFDALDGVIPSNILESMHLGHLTIGHRGFDAQRPWAHGTCENRCTMVVTPDRFDALYGSDTIEKCDVTTLGALILPLNSNMFFDGMWAAECIENPMFEGVLFNSKSENPSSILNVL